MVIIGGLIYIWKKEFFGSGTPVRTVTTETRTSITPTTNIVEIEEEKATVTEAEAPEVTVTTPREAEFYKSWQPDGTSNGFDWFTPIDPKKATGWISVKGYEYAFRHFSPCIKDLKSPDGTVKSFLVDPEKKAMFLVISESPELKISEEHYCRAELEKLGRSSTEFRLRRYDDKTIDVIIGRKR